MRQRIRRARPDAALAGFLKVGVSPMPSWVSFTMAVFVTVSAFDDVRLFLQTEPTGDVPWLWLATAIGYWAFWMVLVFRPRYGAIVFVVMLAVLYPNSEPGGVLLLVFAGIAVAAYRVSTRELVVIVGSFLLWQLVWVPVISRLGAAQLWGYVFVTLLLAAPGLAVKLLRERNLQTERARKMAAETATKAALEERTELARELHDVVTHGLTMIAVQANLGTLSKDAQAQQHALTEIGSMARRSLDDLRRLLQTMRADEAVVGGAGETPSVAPSSACIDLAQSAGDAQKRLNNLGVPTRVSTSGDLAETPNGLRSTVERILQEGATNVVRHTGGHSECEIFLGANDRQIEVLIRNRITAGKPRLPVSGTGLVGLRERVSRLGGTIDTGPVDGWWIVRAVLPFAGRQSLR